jgi:hypothetical protein
MAIRNVETQLLEFDRNPTAEVMNFWREYLEAELIFDLCGIYEPCFIDPVPLYAIDAFHEWRKVRTLDKNLEDRSLLLVQRFRKFENRYHSFGIHYSNRLILALNGFHLFKFATSEKDAICGYCGTTISTGTVRKDISSEHCKRSPTCPFVQGLKDEA